MSSILVRPAQNLSLFLMMPRCSLREGPVLAILAMVAVLRVLRVLRLVCFAAQPRPLRCAPRLGHS